MKTGRQVFETVLATLDNSVTVKSIVSSSASEIVFTVCSNKWLMPNLSFEDASGNTWIVSAFDFDLHQVSALVPSPGLNLFPGQSIFLQKPVFRSGTPMNMENEWNLEEKSGEYPVTPIIWLRESIKGRGFNRESSIAKEFDFEWYALQYSNFTDWLNAERHKQGVVPMTGLADSLVHAFELSFQYKIEGGYSIQEFNAFGKENQDGFTSYLISKNLSGVRYSSFRVSASREACEC